MPDPTAIDEFDQRRNRWAQRFTELIRGFEAAKRVALRDKWESRVEFLVSQGRPLLESERIAFEELRYFVRSAK
jgi:hypothetical protein